MCDKLWYIFRIDDVVPWMNRDNFVKIEKIFDKYWIKPIIWVVPDNYDFTIWNNNYTSDFWIKIKQLYDKWWIIAQHWYHHNFLNKNGWILNINHYWEFAWLSYEKQFQMIEKWKYILEKNLKINIKWWMAPAHSFDKITCKILNELWFEYITDWIALYPFTKYWLKWLPQQLGHPQKKRFWIRTICLHTNNYNLDFINKIDFFCKNNRKHLVNNLDKLNYNPKFLKRIFSYFWWLKLRFLGKLYFYYIKIKKRNNAKN